MLTPVYTFKQGTVTVLQYRHRSPEPNQRSQDIWDTMRGLVVSGNNAGFRKAFVGVQQTPEGFLVGYTSWDEATITQKAQTNFFHALSTLQDAKNWLAFNATNFAQAVVETVTDFGKNIIPIVVGLGALYLLLLTRPWRK